MVVARRRQRRYQAEVSPPPPAWFRPTAIRPAGPRTLGLLAIVFGAVVASMNLLGVVTGNRIGASDDTQFSPEAVEVFNETTRVASLALSVVMVLMSSALVLIGIGLRRYERWALRASVRWSLGALALVGVLAYVNAAVVGPAMGALFASAADPDLADMGAMMRWAGVFTPVVYAPFPLVLWFVLRKPANAAALDQPRRALGG